MAIAGAVCLFRAMLRGIVKVSDVLKKEKSEAKKLIHCSDLTFSYDGKVVTDCKAFDVYSGDYLVVVGENGAGKSTLLKGLLGLKKPTTGTISFEGGLKTNSIGYLPQQNMLSADFPASVWEVVLSGCLNSLGFKPFYGKKEKARAASVLQRLGLDGFEKKCFRDLSGGQKQRVLLARALCATSDLVLLDEPTAGLDPQATKSFYALLDDLNSNSNTTIIMVSHDILDAKTYSSKVLHLGHTWYFGSSEDYDPIAMWRT